MPYDMLDRSMTRFGEEVMPRIRYVLDRDAAGIRAAAGVDRAATSKDSTQTQPSSLSRTASVSL
jgi:hypothetical protein